MHWKSQLDIGLTQESKCGKENKEEEDVLFWWTCGVHEEGGPLGHLVLHFGGGVGKVGEVDVIKCSLQMSCMECENSVEEVKEGTSIECGRNCIM